MDSSTSANPVTLARFLYSTSSHFSPTSGRVKHGAFMPNRKDLSLSVFVLDGMTDTEMHSHGDRWAQRSTEGFPKGFASLPCVELSDHQLRMEVDNTPPRHANVVGFSAEKSEQMSVAQALAGAASLRLKRSLA